MDDLTNYRKNKGCVSATLRKKGNSDKCIEDLLDILYRIGSDDPTHNFNNHKFLSLFQSILHDMQRFTPPLDKKGKSVGTSREELLPNKIYRKLLVYLIINIDTFELDKLEILSRLFTSLEENAVGGYMYLSVNGTSYLTILGLLQKYDIELSYERRYVDDKSRIEMHLIISNLVVITLMQQRIELLES
jgi:hypothetical protein